MKYKYMFSFLSLLTKILKGRDHLGDIYVQDRLKISWTGGNAPLLCRRRRWLFWQVVVVWIT